MDASASEMLRQARKRRRLLSRSQRARVDARVADWVGPHLFRHRAAQSTRVHDWDELTRAANSDLEPDLQKLRSRTRALIQNSGLASGILNTMVYNVVGEGLTPAPAPRAAMLGVDEETVRAFRAAAKDAWQEWSHIADCTEATDINGIQRQLERSALESGDVFFHFVSIPRADRLFDLAVELIEADRVGSLPGDDAWAMGIQRGKFGEPVKFRVYAESDHYLSGDYKDIPRRNASGLVMDQYMSRLRIGQARGIPAFAPVLDDFDHLEAYKESEIVAARVAACIALIIESQYGDEAVANRPGGETDEDGNAIEAMEPGQIYHLQPGEKATGFNPNRPTQTYEPFVVQLIRGICRGMDLAYELGSLNFSQSNYSNTRAAILETRKVFSSRQLNLVRQIRKSVV